MIVDFNFLSEDIQVFLLIYGGFLLLYYFLPVGLAYLVFFVWKRRNWQHRRIQNSFPERKGIQREILWSVISLTIFSVLTYVLWEWFIKVGKTMLYFDIGGYGVGYLIASPVLAIILHDTYYYWMHRAMHHKVVFKFVHKLHHQSVNPTPWAIYAFQPIEAIFTYFSFALAVFVIPLHPVSLGLYLVISLVNNVGGHIGFEILPRWTVRNRVLRYSNVVTFHDMHHTDFKHNFGAYFNIWDRLMNTMHKDYESRFMEVKDQRVQP